MLGKNINLYSVFESRLFFPYFELSKSLDFDETLKKKKTTTKFLFFPRQCIINLK